MHKMNAAGDVVKGSMVLREYFAMEEARIAWEEANPGLVNEASQVRVGPYDGVILDAVGRTMAEFPEFAGRGDEPLTDILADLSPAQLVKFERLVDENGLTSVNKDFQEILNDGTLERVLSQTDSTLGEVLPPEPASPVVDAPENVMADTPEPVVDTPEPVVERPDPAVERQAEATQLTRSGDAGGESGAGPLIVAQREGLVVTAAPEQSPVAAVEGPDANLALGAAESAAAVPAGETPSGAGFGREGARVPEAVLENVVRRNVQEAVVQWMLFSPELVRLAEVMTLGEAIASAPPGADGAMREWGSWVTGNVSPEVWNAVDPQTRAGIRETLLTEKLATLAVNDFVLAENQITVVEDAATPVTSEALPPVTPEVLPPAVSEAVPPVTPEAVPPVVSEVVAPVVPESGSTGRVGDLPAGGESPSPARQDSGFGEAPMGGAKSPETVTEPPAETVMEPEVVPAAGPEQSGIASVEGRRMGEAGAPDEVRMMTAIVKSVESLGELAP
ncbi:hypothetical protein, partial [Streptomyces sp. NPDC057426]|uniref:hypothetical protein n=1 Tax=Streptomyces sp. NPDC057426 TaxID=3346128 RepID=UPI0036C7960C